MAKVGNSLEILNAIMQTDVIDWASYVPFSVSDEGTLRQFGNIIMDEPLVYNAFCEQLVNKVTFTTISRAEFRNPLQRLYKGKTLGNIEDIFIDLPNVKQFKLDSSDSILLNKEDSNVKVSYYIFNVQREYKVTISRDEVAAAFTSIENLNKFIEGKVSAIYTAIEYDSYNLALYLFDCGIINGVVKVEEIDATKPKETYTKLRATSNKFRFISDKFNKAGVKNNAPIERQLIVITADAEAEITVEVLASLFNLSIADYTASRIMVDSFDSVDLDRIEEMLGDSYVDISSELTALGNVYCMLIDEKAAQIYSNWDGGGSFFNPHKNWDNTFWIKSETYAISPFNNAVVFANQTATITGITLSTGVGGSDSSIELAKGTGTPLTITVAGTGLFEKDVTITVSDEDVVKVSAQNYIYVVDDLTEDVTITVKSVTNTSVSATLTIEAPSE